jgi:ribosomal protein L31E
MESSISEKLAERGLFISQKPPQKIEVKVYN